MDGLTQLRAAYVPRLREQLDELDGCLGSRDVAAATRIAHKIAGAAGSYGLGEVSAIARRVEHALEAGAACEAQAGEVEAMRAVIPAVGPVDSSRVILVLGDDPSDDARVVVVADPVDALAVAMDRPLEALVVPYTSGPRGGRALLRSLAAVEEVAPVPLFLTEVDAAEAERVRAKLGAREVFASRYGAAVLARIREVIA